MIDSGINGVGNGTVTYTVAVNPDSVERYGAIDISGKEFVIEQEGSEQSTELPVNAIGSERYGFGWGSGVHKSEVAGTFQNDGNGRLLHVQGYDVDGAVEVGVYLNGDLLEYLSPVSDELGSDTLFLLPVNLQVEGENTVEFRQETPGETWGVQRLGIFSLGSDFGNLSTLTDGDTEHPYGIEFHFSGDADMLLEMAGFDADWDQELFLELNGVDLGSTRQSPNDDWSTTFMLYLPSDLLNVSDNILAIRNRDNSGDIWGFKINGLYSLNTPFGVGVPDSPGEYQNGLLYVFPPSAVPEGRVKLFFRDIDDEFEVEI